MKYALTYEAWDGQKLISRSESCTSEEDAEDLLAIMLGIQELWEGETYRNGVIVQIEEQNEEA